SARPDDPGSLERGGSKPVHRSRQRVGREPDRPSGAPTFGCATQRAECGVRGARARVLPGRHLGRPDGPGDALRILQRLRLGLAGNGAGRRLRRLGAREHRRPRPLPRGGATAGRQGGGTPRSRRPVDGRARPRGRRGARQELVITPGHDEGHEFWPPPGWGRRVVWALTAILLAVCALVAFRVLSIDTLALSTKTLLVLFMLLPLPLCFVLVRAYTRMLEDERVKALSEAWLRCENGYVGTPEYQQAQAESTEAALFADRLRIFYDRMQGYVLQQHPELAELYLAIRKIAVREGPAADDKDNFPAEWVAMAARSLAAIELRMAGLNRRAYTLPVFFFAFAYMAGLILMLPAFEMFEAEVVPHWANVTLSFVNTTVVLPLMVVQAGYLGGAAFAAFTIISRVLNRDINPRLF